MQWERDFAYSTDEALSLMKGTFKDSCPMTGLNKLRRTLALNFDLEVSNKLRQREWLLIKDDAYWFDWGTFEKDFQEQQLTQACTKLIASPPVQPTKSPFEFAVIDSETNEPLLQRKCDFRPDGAAVERKTDKEGLTYLTLYAAPVEMIVRLKT